MACNGCVVVCIYAVAVSASAASAVAAFVAAWAAPRAVNALKKLTLALLGDGICFLNVAFFSVPADAELGRRPAPAR